MLMLDLCAGLGGASAAFRDRGWDAVTVDNDPRFGPDVLADVCAWSWAGPRPDFVWASPPCVEFSRESMPWCRTGRTPSLDIVRACRRIIGECAPTYWVIENVRGAMRWLEPELGPYAAHFGPFYLWGVFPPLGLRIRMRPKESYSSTQSAERAMIPPALSRAMAMAVEAQIPLPIAVEDAP